MARTEARSGESVKTPVADPNIWLYCALLLILIGQPSLGSVCVLLHLARCPVPRGPQGPAGQKKEKK